MVGEFNVGCWTQSGPCSIDPERYQFAAPLSGLELEQSFPASRVAFPVLGEQFP
jgi:hypothetical protein